VDDNDSLRIILRRVLASWDFEVFVADGVDAAAALAAGMDCPVDLLLTDVVMPRGSGKVLATRLRESQPGLRVVFMSGYQLEALRSFEFGPGDHFLRKPFTPKVLREMVACALREAGPS
jgi:DNA-binding response OmpR family regulator